MRYELTQESTLRSSSDTEAFSRSNRFTLTKKLSLNEILQSGNLSVLVHSFARSHCCDSSINSYSEGCGRVLLGPRHSPAFSW